MSARVEAPGARGAVDAEGCRSPRATQPARPRRTMAADPLAWGRPRSRPAKALRDRSSRSCLPGPGQRLQRVHARAARAIIGLPEEREWPRVSGLPTTTTRRAPAVAQRTPAAPSAHAAAGAVASVPARHATLWPPYAASQVDQRRGRPSRHRRRAMPPAASRLAANAGARRVRRDRAHGAASGRRDAGCRLRRAAHSKRASAVAADPVAPAPWRSGRVSPLEGSGTPLGPVSGRFRVATSPLALSSPVRRDHGHRCSAPSSSRPNRLPRRDGQVVSRSFSTAHGAAGGVGDRWRTCDSAIGQRAGAARDPAPEPDGPTVKGCRSGPHIDRGGCRRPRPRRRRPWCGACSPHGCVRAHHGPASNT